MSVVGRVKASIRRNRETAKAIRELNQLSDRSIRDIGLQPHLVRLGKRGYPWK